MKIKVLHVINSLDLGGAEILLTNSLSPGGLCEYTDNHLAFFMAPNLVDRLDKKVHVHFLDYKGGKDIFRLLKQLHSIIKENKIDVVHSHLNPAGTYTHIANPKNIPHVHTIHTTYSMDKETNRFKLWIEKNFYLKQKNSNLIFLSDFTRDDFLQHVSYKGRHFVLNNFVQDSFFKNTAKEYEGDRNSLKLVTTGRLSKGKNFEYLLKIFSHLKNREIYLDIYGAGDKTQYEAEINEQRIKVRMMGPHNCLAEVLDNYDLFIMASKFEGFPLSVFEAMASGLPLMLSNIKPLKSIVKEHAIYFELNNDKAVADTIQSILDKKIGINGLARNGKIFAEKTVRRDKYIRELLDIYSQLLFKS